MASQFGFGCFPKFFGLQSSGILQPFLEDFQLGGKLLAGCHPLHPKPFAITPCPAIVGKPQKIKRLRLFPSLLSILDGESPKLHHLGLRRFQLKPKLAQTFTQFLAKPLRFLLILKADDKIIDITDEPGKPCAALAVNLLKPEIKGVVKIDVRQQRRNDPLLGVFPRR